MNRREMLQGLVAAAVGSTGCVSIGIEAGPANETKKDGEEILSIEAEAVAVEAATIQRTGYVEERDITFRLTQTVSVGEKSYIVQAVNDLIEYERAVEYPKVGRRSVARFTAVATPEVELFSQEIDFVEQVTNEAMGNGLQSEYDHVEINDTVITTDSISLFEENVPVFQYAGVAEMAGHELEIYFHVAKALREGDYITLIGMYPQSLVEEEQDRMFELMESIE